MYNSRLYYIKYFKGKRNNDGSFESDANLKLKKIPYVYEVYSYIQKLHDNNNHCPKDKLIKLKDTLDIYIDSLDFLIERYIRQCPVCITKYFSSPVKSPIKIITDEGPHFRYLMDITYLKNDIYKKKTTFKYIIDFIDHFTKFYLGFLIKDKCTETILKYIKLFIQINKKLKIFQCDNGTEFANHLISNFMESQNIKLIHSRPHHP